MESFAALLTGILLAAFLWYVRSGVRAKARRKAEELGGAVLYRVSWPLSTPQVLLFVLAGVAVFVLGAYFSIPASSLCAFEAGFFPLLIVNFALARGRHLELREHGLMLPERAAPLLVPWNEVRYCKWLPAYRRFFMQLGARNVTFAMKPARLDALMAVLLPRVEVRDESGNVLNPDREPLEIDLPWEPESPRYQFHLRTLLLFLVVASSAFAWLGIHLQVGWRQQAVLAEYEKLGPTTSWYGNRVTALDFSQCKTSPGDDDLVYLKDLPNLRFLNLTNTQITDAGLVHLEPLKQLQTVGLTGTQVTDTGVRKLQESLPDTAVVH